MIVIYILLEEPFVPPFPISHYTNISDANEKQKQKKQTSWCFSLGGHCFE